MLSELVGVLEQDTAPDALIGTAQASYSVRSLVRGLKELGAAAERTSKREIEADQRLAPAQMRADFFFNAADRPSDLLI